MIGREKECEVSIEPFLLEQLLMFCLPNRRNFGQGRYIPFYNNKVKVHISVQRRIEQTKGNVDAYTPQAHNWDTLQEMHMVQYVV